MSKRTQQIASTIQQAVQEVIGRGLGDPRISGLITITGVRVAEDLRNAEISVSIYPEEREQLTMHGLQAAAKHIRREAGELVAIRQLPALTFRLDRSLKRQAEVLQAIAKAAAQLPPAPPAAETESEQLPSMNQPPTPDAPTNAGTDEAAGQPPAARNPRQEPG